MRIYKGHKVEWYTEKIDSELVLPRLGIPECAHVIGCISRIKARKGISELIQSMDLMTSGTEVHLVILGRVEDQSYRSALESSASRERIHLLGFLPGAARIAAEFDIITLPSLRREGLPRAVIEGMAHGVAPVVTNAGGSPELIEHGVSGLIVPPGDPAALAEAFNVLLSDDERRKAMGQAAQQRIRTHFDTDQSVAQTFALYNDVVAGYAKKQK